MSVRSVSISADQCSFPLQPSAPLEKASSMKGSLRKLSTPCRCAALLLCVVVSAHRYRCGACVPAALQRRQSRRLGRRFPILARRERRDRRPDHRHEQGRTKTRSSSIAKGSSPTSSCGSSTRCRATTPACSTAAWTTASGSSPAINATSRTAGTRPTAGRSTASPACSSMKKAACSSDSAAKQ